MAPILLKVILTVNPGSQVEPGDRLNWWGYGQEVSGESAAVWLISGSIPSNEIGAAILQPLDSERWLAVKRGTELWVSDPKHVLHAKVVSVYRTIL